MAAASIDLFQIIFEQILKIDPTLIAKYTAIQDQLLYLILIPSIVLLLFLWTFGYWVVPGHRGIRILLSTIAYVFIVWSGWYGTFIISIINLWFPLILITFFIFFILTRLFHPLNVPGAHKIISAGFDQVKGSIKKGKDKEKMERELQLVDQRIRELDRILGDPNLDAKDRAALRFERAELDNIRRRLRIELGE